MWNGKRARIATTILKKNKLGLLTLLNFEIICNYSNQDCVVFMERQPLSSIKQNKETRNSLSQVQPIDF